MTPRCRKPVFTFSPIDEPADDLVPNSDSLQIANMIQPQPSVQESASSKMVDKVVTCSEATNSEATCSEATCSEATCSEATSSEKENSTEDNSDISLTEDSENSILSGCALIHESSLQESRGSLTSPFKKYLMERDIQILDESVKQEEVLEESTTSHRSLLESEKPISDSLIEFLDGQEQNSESFAHSSPTSRPSPPLTKSILFETSL